MRLIESVLQPKETVSHMFIALGLDDQLCLLILFIDLADRSNISSCTVSIFVIARVAMVTHKLRLQNEKKRWSIIKSLPLVCCRVYSTNNGGVWQQLFAVWKHLNSVRIYSWYHIFSPPLSSMSSRNNCARLPWIHSPATRGSFCSQYDSQHPLALNQKICHS